MKTPQGWTNYSGGTYFVRVPMVPTPRSTDEAKNGTVKDESGSEKPAGANGSKVAARAR